MHNSDGVYMPIPIFQFIVPPTEQTFYRNLSVCYEPHHSLHLTKTSDSGQMKLLAESGMGSVKLGTQWWTKVWHPTELHKWCRAAGWLTATGLGGMYMMEVTDCFFKVISVWSQHDSVKPENTHGSAADTHSTHTLNPVNSEQLRMTHYNHIFDEVRYVVQYVISSKFKK